MSFKVISICHTGSLSGTFRPIIKGSRCNKHQFSCALLPTDPRAANLPGTRLGRFVLSLHLYGKSQMKFELHQGKSFLLDEDIK